ncbi:caspase, EACC1-associated type [Nocardia lijiangensis]|uniref:caspase, EACC1-associated type n=1 Tax=Nocardia lijiangensis TaxID=299618 RepID=UPI000830AB27|nr:Hsp70 family protein [Nocardia lijiangensis]
MVNRSLIIANQHYDDPAYAELPGAERDAAELQAVLADPDIAGFEVQVLRDGTAAQCRKAIETFFRGAGGDDLLLLHISCHGQKDRHNRLYLVGTDTEKTYVASTGIDSTFISDQIEGSRSNKTVLMLDCCYSGAFSRGLRTRSAAESVDVREPFSGRGRVVITASTSLQFSHESEATSRAAAEPSVFTSAVVHGLRSGDADLDGDGWISIDDLYGYVHEAVRRRAPNQTPTRSVASVQGALYLARNVAARPRHVPGDIRDALRSKLAWQRIGALHELENLLGSWRPEVRDAARVDLTALVSDPDPAVAKLAQQLWFSRGLGELPVGAERGVSRPPGGDRPRTRYAVGIDFGTTNSAIAVFLDDDVRVALTAIGERTMPSVAAVTETGNWIVGEEARRRATINPASTFSRVKLALGTDERFRAFGRTYTPVGVAATLLTELRLAAERFIGAAVRDVVITIPAHFDLIQRGATVEAAALAGLNVMRLLNEPTAAALAYGANAETEQTIMVFDLGGGTLDVSVLEISDGVVEVLATGGDNRLGGVDWDDRLVDHAVGRFRRQHGIDLSADQAAMARLREAAERAKIELSARMSTEISLPTICVGPNGPIDLELPVTRTEFEELTRDLIDRCRTLIQRAVRDAYLTTARLHQIALVGGATRMPAIVGLVQDVTGRQPRREVIPDGVVLGATLQAAVLIGQVKDTLLLDVSPSTVGVADVNGRIVPIIERNTTAPTKRSLNFTTAVDDQRHVQVQLFEGESRLASRNRRIGVLELGGLTPQPRGVAEIEVSVDIDANRLVHMQVKDLESGRSVQMNVTLETARAHEAARVNPAHAIVEKPANDSDSS